MFKRTLVSRCVVLAMLAGSIALASDAQAKNDFEALLADINFGATPSEPDPAPSPSAIQTQELSAPPADIPMTMPTSVETPLPAASAVQAVAVEQPMPAIPQPVSDPAGMVAVPVADAGCASCSSGCASNGCAGNCGQCQNGCGKQGCNMLKGVACQPYTVPNLPTSTFYQYWRSNACNTHVWDGYRNRCHKRLDLSCKHGKSCGNGHCGNGCASGKCGPAPSEWCNSGCDQCDGQ